MHTEIGERLVQQSVQSLEDVAIAESPAKLLGKILTVVLAPAGKRKRKHRNPPWETRLTLM